MPRRVPTLKDTAFWSQRTELDGFDYRLSFAYNMRDASWYLSIAQTDGTLILGSVRLVSNRPLLLRRHALPLVPPGEFWMHDPTGLIDVADYAQLGRDVELWYLDAAELGRA
jgi:hypothetical protein